MTGDPLAQRASDVWLRGERVYLRPLSDQDTNSILHWRSDPTVASQLFSECPPSRAEHEAWLAAIRQSHERIEFVIVLCEGHRPIGTIGLSHINRQCGEAEYGILLGEAEHRNKGLAREASCLILDFAFHALNLRLVKLRMFADNEAARRLYERLGFVAKPALATTHKKNGRLRLVTVMCLTRERWDEMRRGNVP